MSIRFLFDAYTLTAEWIKNNLAYANWEPHHVAVVSKWLHEQAEKKPHDWNFNIG